MLNKKESVTAALKRYSGGGAAAGKKGGKNAKGEAGKDGRDMDKFNKLTETADALLYGGYSDIYLSQLPLSPFLTTAYALAHYRE
jgi:hypothetical protein